MFDPTTLTGFHTWLSLIAIAAGLLLLPAMAAGRPAGGLAELFLATAVLTSATGFLFPFNGFLPSHAVGVLALAVLAAVLAGRFGFGLAGRWVRVYAAGFVVSLYFLLFVLVAQIFMKVPGLGGDASPGFLVAQLALLVAAGWLGVVAWRRAGLMAR